MRTVAIMAISILSLITSVYGQNKIAPRGNSPVDFFTEEITLSVSDSISQISGIYYFRNNTSNDKPFTAMFPFYVDSLSAFPDKIRAYIVTAGDTAEIDYRPIIERDAIVLQIPLVPNGVTSWHLDYSQRISFHRAVYIITSTAAWKKPLEEATYRFVVPARFDSVLVWPEPDSTKRIGSNIEYISHKTNFMPQRDMEIIWK
jgi:hypothetical protein